MIERHEEAVADFDEVVKKNPKNAHAHFRRAFSLKALKVSNTSFDDSNLTTISCVQRYPEAADDFEKAKTLDPLNP